MLSLVWCVHRFCEEVVKVLGLDWVLLFAQGHLHPSTVLIALRMLVALLSNASILQKFRDATHNGGWMTDAQQVTSNKSGQFLGKCVAGFFLGVFLLISLPFSSPSSSSVCFHTVLSILFLLIFLLLLFLRHGSQMITVDFYTAFFTQVTQWGQWCAP